MRATWESTRQQRCRNRSNSADRRSISSAKTSPLKGSAKTSFRSAVCTCVLGCRHQQKQKRPTRQTSDSGSTSWRMRAISVLIPLPLKKSRPSLVFHSLRWKELCREKRLIFWNLCPPERVKVQLWYQYYYGI